MSELAGTLRYSPSRLSHAVSRLESEGWVERVPHPTDRRTTLARLTDEGMRVVRATAPGHVAEVRRLLFDALSPHELATLHAVFEKTLRTLTDDAGCSVA
jgi:DNA-binding MarR family transcriptional regulator